MQRVILDAFLQSLSLPPRGHLVVYDEAIGVLEPPPELTVSEWADANRMLSSETSSEPGKWKTSRAAYLKGIMDAFNDPQVETVVVEAASQVGKSEVLNNTIGYFIDYDPAPILMVQPTLDTARAYSKERISRMLRDTPALRRKVRDPKTRDSDNTVLTKVFPGGNIALAGANSPAGLASRARRVILLDEVDRFPPDCGGEGDPVDLALKRSATFWNRKHGLTSTPTIKGLSRIDDAFQQSDQRRFYVPCPGCGEYQVLKWKQVKWEPNRPETAAYVCAFCGSLWDDAARWKAVSKGEWRAEAPFKGVAGFHLNAFYSPWSLLPEVVAKFLEVKDYPERLRVWINTVLGEVWEDEGETVDDTGLLNRREDYGPAVPNQVIVLTAGIDIQDDRIEVEVVGWGIKEEAWSIAHLVLWGDPANPAIWEALDKVLAKRWPKEDGKDLLIQAACIDTGGHHTQAAYQYCAARWGRRVWAIIGRSGPRPVWNKKPTRNNKAGVRLFTVGVDAAKDALYARLRKQDPGAAYIHFPIDPNHDEEYFRQLTAEKALTKYNKGYKSRVWTQVYYRNEVLDCWVYAYAALCGLMSMGADLTEEPKPKPTTRRKKKRRIRSSGINGD